MKLLHKYKQILNILYSPKYLTATNIVVGSGLMACGDAVAQSLEIYITKTRESLDTSRVWRLGIIGAVLCGPQSYYYSWLDKWLPGTTFNVVFKKVIMDQFLVAIPSNSFFFTANKAMETGSLTDGVQHMTKVFPAAYIADWCYWPFFQAINFYFIPTKYRITYLSVTTLVWNSFLCYLHLHMDRQSHRKMEL